ncbi:hypothetical protein TanjilG_13900 [Lupinus angustifolius]|uniref:Uncharacterized protein n=1 Tax=Lupinus angustifolius TaxID=3871 RepID=A0A1J7GVV6_LUPAN|nr:hypothetical protein TanjilG_13898 [Lupinus angustifolius]OIW04518.1 hypothetical protein TanjilG_13900 [Lupinus angustifolius]
MKAKQKIVAMAEEEEQHNAVVKIYTKSETRVKNNLHNHKFHATVIPAPRKSVKRMMFEEMLQFLTRLFTNSRKLLQHAQNKVSQKDQKTHISLQ